MAKQADPFDEFLDYYEKGLWKQALRTVIPHPAASYDACISRERAFFYFVNYADACVFKGAMEFKQTFLVLEALCKESPTLKVLADRFLEAISQEYELFSCFFYSAEEMEALPIPPSVKCFFTLLNQGMLDHRQEIEELFQALPPLFQDLLKGKMDMILGWEILKKTKPALAQVLDEKKGIYKQPWHAFSYPLSIQAQPGGKIEGLPLIFLEPLENVDYAAFLRPYCQQEFLLVFQTVAHLYQLLQFPALHGICAQPHAHLYVLDLYPQSQLLHQAVRWQQERSFYPVWMIANPHLEQALPALTEALKACLMQPEENFKQDTAESNWLYAVSKQVLLAIESNRYGKSRSIALSIEQGLQKWFDPHKGGFPSSVSLGLRPINYLEEDIKERLSKREPRPFAPRHKIRLAHIVPQIVDGGHAPSKLLKTLCNFADRHWFQVFVISTERLSDRLMSYPITSYSSSPSFQRGLLTMAFLKEIGISLRIDSDSPTYEASVKQAVQTLEDLSIDIAVFHGPDELNSLISSSTNVPIRILFDHGTLPSYPCFDLAILSTDEAYRQKHDLFRQMGMESCILHFSIDVRQEWEDTPFSRQEIGLPDNCFVMTTISNHLDTRLTEEMCHAIGKILKRCPQAVYAPIGESSQQEKLNAIFDRYGAADRVFFLGNRPSPSQYARSMHLYLNEFPFGSGLGILDAMAAGCPVVSMYDEQGPQQARYAATYFGSDYVVKTGRVEDYVDLACRLIEDPELYKQWSAHALEQYEKRVDTARYVKSFQTILEQFIDYYQNQQRH